jgi:aspartyl-tRNA synthetase
MAESTNENTVPTDPAIAPPAAEASASTGEAGETSKKGAKKAAAKAAKEAEKARKAAEREAAAGSSAAAAAEDHAKENYGDFAHTTTLPAEPVSLKHLTAKHVGTTVKLWVWIQNSRAQGAKMAFVELREAEDWTIQGVVSASAEGKPVSKQMVKWINGLTLESFVVVEASVQKPLEPVKSCKVSEYELHITKIYLVAPAPAMLGLSLAAASRPVGKLDDEEQSEATIESEFSSGA